MKIHNLTLDGYKTFEKHVEYSFDDGITLLSGENARGKSSIFSALRLLITNQNDDTLENCINWNGATSFLLESEFSHEGTNFKTSLQCTKKGKSIVSDRKLWINDNLAEEGSENVVNRLAEYFDPKITDVALFSLQGKNQIVECDDATRREVLKKIYDISFDKEIDELEVEAKKIDANIQESVKKIYALENKDYHIDDPVPLPFTSEEFQLKEKELQDVEKKLLDLANSTSLIEVYKKLKEGVPIKESLLKKAEEEKELLIRKDAQLQIDFRASQALLDTLPSLLEEKFRLEESNLQLQYTTEENALNAIVLERIAKEFPRKEELDSLLTEVATLKSELSQLEKKLEKVNKGLCSECGRPYEISDKEALVEEIKSLTLKKEAKESQLAECKTEADAHNKKLEDLEKKKTQKQLVTDKIVSLQNKIDALERQKETEMKLETQRLTNRIETTKTSIETNNEKMSLKETDVGNISLSIEDDSIKLTKLDETLGDIAALEATVSTLNSKKLDLATLMGNYSKALIRNQAIEESNLSKEIEKERDKETLKALVTEKETQEASKLYYKEVKSILEKELPNHIIAQSVEGIEDAMNSFIDFIFYKPLNVKLEQVKQSIRLEYGSKDKKIPSKSASGAEKALIQLSFINAFNQELDLKCVCLDEIDAAISDENSETLFESLGTMKDIYSQVFIITHNKSMIDYLVANYNAEVIQL